VVFGMPPVFLNVYIDVHLAGAWAGGRTEYSSSKYWGPSKGAQIEGFDEN
jgi:hypothetical protein